MKNRLLLSADIEVYATHFFGGMHDRQIQDKLARGGAQHGFLVEEKRGGIVAGLFGPGGP